MLRRTVTVDGLARRAVALEATPVYYSGLPLSSGTRGAPSLRICCYCETCSSHSLGDAD